MRQTSASPSSLAVLGVAVLAVSSSAVLVRWADASPVALAFWRTLGGAVILAPAAVRSPVRPSGRQWPAIGVAGLALGIHFSAWLASLELTSVAASVTLVSTAPIFIAGALAIGGRGPGRRTWSAIGLAVLGTLVIAGGDALGGWGDGSALLGDGLALVGAATMAVYLLIGDRLRATLSTPTYAGPTYAVAAATTLCAAMVAGIDLSGYDRTTWLAIGGMIVGPQLAGHTAFNHLLGRLGSVTVSLSLLAEPIGAAVLVWLFFAEIPPLGAVLGAPLVIGAVALHLLSGPRRPPTTPARPGRPGTAAGDGRADRVQG